jgi:hypothetical protein
MSGDRGTTAGRALCSLTWLLPRRADYAGLRRSWPRNLAAGVTVGVVALPLVLAAIVYAASGVGAATGLDPAVVAGAMAAVFAAPPSRCPAVEFGLGVAIVLALVHRSRTARAVPEPLTDDGIDSTTEHALLAGQVLAYRLDGPLFFAVADRLFREITATTDVRVVILRPGSVAMLDATGASVPGEIVEHLHRRHHGSGEGRPRRAPAAAHRSRHPRAPHPAGTRLRRLPGGRGARRLARCRGAGPLPGRLAATDRARGSQLVQPDRHVGQAVR